MMKKFSLIDIYLNTNIVKPHKNINTQINQDRPEKAALYFMSSAFSGLNSKIKAKVKVQDDLGNVRSYSVTRMPIQKKNKIVYKHFLS
jgi:hypothetical protein